LGFGGICRGIGLTRTGWLTPYGSIGQHEDHPITVVNTYPMLCTEVRPNRRQWCGDAEPEEYNQQQGAEWNGSRGTSRDQEQVQQEHDSEYHTER